MRRSLLLLNGLLIGCRVAGAQHAARRDTVVTYLDRRREAVSSAQEAAFRVKTVPTDSLGGVKLRYALDGWLVERQEYSNLALQVRHGLNQEYYPHSRQLKLVAPYHQGRLEGELRTYFPSGRLQRREQYREFVSQGRQCYSEQGQPVAFTPYLVLPEYPGGRAALMRFIGSRLQYPEAALKAELEGRVYVSFVVDEQGRATKARVLKPLHPALDAEALRVIQLLGSWQPGRLAGKATAMSFTLPVIFRLE